MICDDTSIQPLLPQVMVISSKVLSVAQFEVLRASLSDNVSLVRKGSGWNDHMTQVEIIFLLSRCLADIVVEKQVILLFDACKVHLAPAVLTALAIVKIWYVVIPAKLTWMLQPLDLMAFVCLKRFMRLQFQRRLAADSGLALVVQMVRIVCDGIRLELQGRRWRRAFELVGSTGTQDGFSRSMIVELELEGVPTAPRERPSLDDLRRCWPRDLHADEQFVRNMNTNGHQTPRNI